MNENILAVNIPNIVSITLMAMLGFAAIHLLTSLVSARKMPADEEG